MPLDRHKFLLKARDREFGHTLGRKKHRKREKHDSLPSLCIFEAVEQQIVFIVLKVSAILLRRFLSKQASRIDVAFVHPEKPSAPRATPMGSLNRSLQPHNAQKHLPMLNP